MRKLVLALLLLSGCAHGIYDENGNHFHSEEEKRTWTRENVGRPEAEIQAALVGHPVQEPITNWGAPDKTAALGNGGSVYEWSIARHNWVSFYTECRVWVTVNATQIIADAHSNGKCLWP